jgi:hypothetical protein
MRLSYETHTCSVRSSAASHKHWHSASSHYVSVALCVFSIPPATTGQHIKETMLLRTFEGYMHVRLHVLCRFPARFLYSISRNASPLKQYNFPCPCFLDAVLPSELLSCYLPTRSSRTRSCRSRVRPEHSHAPLVASQLLFRGLEAVRSEFTSPSISDNMRCPLVLPLLVQDSVYLTAIVSLCMLPLAHPSNITENPALCQAVRCFHTCALHRSYCLSVLKLMCSFGWLS